MGMSREISEARSPAMARKTSTQLGERWRMAASGRIGTGMFVFRKACLDRTGYLPAWRDHKQLADGVDEWLGYETGYSYAKKWVGNPHGEDWALYRALSMHFKSHAIKACLYIHYVR